MSHTPPEWRLKKFDFELAQRLSRELGLQVPTIKAILSNELDKLNDIERYLNPNFEDWANLKSFPSMQKGIDALLPLLQSQKKVCVHGDFDSDGLCATLVLKECLSLLNIDCFAYIPSREDGHGITEASVQKVKDLGAELIITVDCGITANEAARCAKEAGIELIITDHHLPDAELPLANAIINPQLDHETEFRILSGAGISLKICFELAKHFPPSLTHQTQFKEFIPHAIILAAIATIGDVVPLTGHNRSLVHQALLLMKDVTWPCLKALFKVSGLNGNTKSSDLAFQVIPRMNAAQRMERADLIWSLLNSRDHDESKDICENLNKLNLKRRELQSQYTEEILKDLKKEFTPGNPIPALVVSGTAWPEGISGLIASKLSELYHCPAFVIRTNDDYGQASCRAPKGYHLKDALDQCSDLLLSSGGHAQAAGFRIIQENIENFKERMNALFIKQRELMPNPKFMITDELKIQQINQKLIQEVAQLEPFGHANPKPVFATRGVMMDGVPHYIGQNKQHALLKFFSPGHPSLPCIAFNIADTLRQLDQYGKFDIAYFLENNKYGKSMQLQIQAIRQHRA